MGNLASSIHHGPICNKAERTARLVYAYAHITLSFRSKRQDIKPFLPLYKIHLFLTGYLIMQIIYYGIFY